MQLYNDYNSYLKTRYGCKVYKIGLDAGFSCPGRCLYCNAEGSRAAYTDPKTSIATQLKTRIDYLKEARQAEKFIAYFQAFTNTFADIDRLKNIYDQVLAFKEIVAISIGTRPDTIDKEKLELIGSYKNGRDVWVEYGLQSSHDRTLKLINRGHTYKDFACAVNMTKKFKISVCGHVILGLPQETGEDMIQTAKRLNGLEVEGVKIHLLHILKGSALEGLYNKGEVQLLGQDEYAGLVCDFLENLSEDIIIQRLTGQGTRENHIAPLWALDKIGTINKIDETLRRRKTYQGYNLGRMTKEAIS